MHLPADSVGLGDGAAVVAGAAVVVVGSSKIGSSLQTLPRLIDLDPCPCPRTEKSKEKRWNSEFRGEFKGGE